MNRFKNLSNMEKGRINELRLRSLVNEMLNVANNNFVVVREYIKSLSMFFDFNLEMILNIIEEIIKNKYAPTVDEIIKVNLLLGLSIPEVAEMLNMNINTVKTRIYKDNSNANSMVIYPRLNAEELKEVKKFLIAYYSFYVPTDKIFLS